MRPVTFHRAEGFYPVELMEPEVCGKSLVEQAAEHAALNPGTICIRDTCGQVLWAAKQEV
jgi:hypothetical protein